MDFEVFVQMSSDVEPKSGAELALSVCTMAPNHTHRLGRSMAMALCAGDTVCVSGPLGAGKSEICRAIIRGLSDDPQLEVPSPSYTLVNVYDHPDCEIWHADLYRIGDESEIEEIGLDDAVSHAILLVEWPERWTQAPSRRLDVVVCPIDGDRREYSVTPVGQGWDDVMEAVRVSA